MEFKEYFIILLFSHCKLDCAVVVCAVMRQYVHHVDVARSLQGTNGIVLRANMVKGFVNDISRGLKHST